MNGGNINCPKCNVVLEPLSYQGITIDKCPKCKGVWIDSGEEDFVVEILRLQEKKSCIDCARLFEKKKCNLLGIYVSPDFYCSNFMPK